MLREELPKFFLRIFASCAQGGIYRIVGDFSWAGLDPNSPLQHPAALRKANEYSRRSIFGQYSVNRYRRQRHHQA